MTQLTKDCFYKICLDLKISNNIWIGLSGGLDSTVLLYLSHLAFNNNINYNINAVYINHNVNNNALSWQKYCQAICKKLNINFQAISINPNIINNKKLGLEATLRTLRINVWKKLLTPKDTLLLAHHLNDQAETMFLRLLRGSGLTGLGSIREISFLSDIKIIRPLLNFTREELENFAKKHNLSYIIDDSNYDKNFSRNFLRHEILPKLAVKWPKYLNNINRTIKHLQLSDQFIKNQANNALLSCYKNLNINNILVINNLLKHEYFLQTEIVRCFITNQGFNPPDELKLKKIYTEIIAAKPDRQPQLNFGEYVIYRYRDCLYLYSADYLKNQEINIKNFSFKTTLDDLDIYFGNCIDYIGLGKAKKIFQKLGIPPWQRKDYPLVFQQGKLIAIIGLWVK